MRGSERARLLRLTAETISVCAEMPREVNPKQVGGIVGGARILQGASRLFKECCD